MVKLVNNDTIVVNNITIVVIENIVRSLPIPNGIVFPSLNNNDGLSVKSEMIQIIKTIVDKINLFLKNICIYYVKWIFYF